MKRLIAVAAGKGGVGKSTVAVQLALSLKRLGQKVGLLDADLYGPSVRHMLPEEHLPKQVGDKWLPAYFSGMPYMSLSYFRGDAAVRAPVANQLISLLLEGVNWGDLDALIIDFPPGTGDIHLTLCQRAQLCGAVIVTLPGEMALLDVRKAVTLFQKAQVPILGVVENMSYLADAPHFSPFGKSGGRRLARELDVPFLGEVPLDQALNQANDTGKSGSYHHPIFEEMAKALIAVENQEEKSLQFDSKNLFFGDKAIVFSELQRHCPCAGCIEKRSVEDDVSLQKVERVGHYGWQFQFSSGCSNGIYTDAQLEAIGKS